MNNRELERPEFTTSIRGYDRLQVDDYIDRLQSLVADLDERSRAAESELEFSRHSTVGPRVAQIFDLAVEEAKELRNRVEAEADKTRATARTEADEIVAEAREASERSAAETRAEREKAIAEIDARRERADRDVEELQHRKSELLADLRRLQEALAAAAGLAGGVEDALSDDDPTAEVEAAEPPSAEAA